MPPSDPSAVRAADLRGADLTGALFLTRGQLQSAVDDASTRIPDRLTRPAHRRANVKRSTVAR